MKKRKIIFIDEDKCNGCGACIPNCAEGAIQIVNGKAKLIADKFCDGLGACLGHCPEDALHIVERDADNFDEVAVEKLLKQQHEPKHLGCPGSRVMNLSKTDTAGSQLRQWPVQFMLVPNEAEYFNGADLLITADCVPFAYPNYHLDILKDKRVIIGCPKLDDSQYYVKKLTEILTLNDVKSLTVAHMEVPCCSGMIQIAKVALAASGKNIPLKTIKIGIDGTIQNS